MLIIKKRKPKLNVQADYLLAKLLNTCYAQKSNLCFPVV